jgi:inorganic pyrophosphatase
MAKKQNGKAGLADPTKLKPVLKNNKVQVVIETVKGSRNKCAFDPDQRVFTLKKVLPEGMVFPHDFGFIPSTKAPDGDPLDVLLLMDDPVFAGCVVESRLVGVIEGEQKQDGKKERNDRLLAVAESSHTHSDVKSIDDLNHELLLEIEKFFVNYHENDGATFKVLACKGPDAAAKLLKKSLK